MKWSVHGHGCAGASVTREHMNYEIPTTFLELFAVVCFLSLFFIYFIHFFFFLVDMLPKWGMHYGWCMR